MQPVAHLVEKLSVSEPRRPCPAGRARPFVPCLDCLEDRLAPAVLTVSSLLDPAVPAPGAISTDTGLSLREAIDLVNGTLSLSQLPALRPGQVTGTLGGNDQIQFAPGLTGSIRLTQRELDISRSVVITGPGADKLTIDAQHQSGDFIVRGGNVTLAGLKIINGQAFSGGGIFNATPDMLTVSGCTLSGNRAVNSGGPAGGDGGGIENVRRLTVNNSTLSGNSADLSGGGVGNGGTLAMSNCTLFGNVATGLIVGRSRGGAIANQGTATLTSLTVTDNVTGVGWAVDQESGTLLLHNTIVAGNFSGHPGGPAADIAGTVDPGSSFNLIGTGGNGGLSATDGHHNLVGISNLGLGLLADNGGPTQTCALAGSPAGGAGDPALAGTADQRGVVRTGYVSVGAFQDTPPPGRGGSGGGGSGRVQSYPLGVWPPFWDVPGSTPAAAHAAYHDQTRM
jgi:hypothetical protein